MAQLYMDGTIEPDKWKNFLHEKISSAAKEETPSDTSCTFLAGMCCECHLIEFLSDIRFLCEEELIDDWIYRDYNSFVDMMFDYRHKKTASASLPSMRRRCCPAGPPIANRIATPLLVLMRSFFLMLIINI